MYQWQANTGSRLTSNKWPGNHFKVQVNYVKFLFLYKKVGWFLLLRLEVGPERSRWNGTTLLINHGTTRLLGSLVFSTIVFLDTGTGQNKKNKHHSFVFRISWTRKNSHFTLYNVRSFSVSAKDLASYVLISTPDILPSNTQT